MQFTHVGEQTYNTAPLFVLWADCGDAVRQCKGAEVWARHQALVPWLQANATVPRALWVPFQRLVEDLLDVAPTSEQKYYCYSLLARLTHTLEEEGLGDDEGDEGVGEDTEEETEEEAEEGYGFYSVASSGVCASRT